MITRLQNNLFVRARICWDQEQPRFLVQPKWQSMLGTRPGRLPVNAWSLQGTSILWYLKVFQGILSYFKVIYDAPSVDAYAFDLNLCSFEKGIFPRDAIPMKAMLRQELLVLLSLVIFSSWWPGLGFAASNAFFGKEDMQFAMYHSIFRLPIMCFGVFWYV